MGHTGSYFQTHVLCITGQLSPTRSIETATAGSPPARLSAESRVKGSLAPLVLVGPMAIAEKKTSVNEDASNSWLQ